MKATWGISARFNPFEPFVELHHAGHEGFRVIADCPNNEIGGLISDMLIGGWVHTFPIWKERGKENETKSVDGCSKGGNQE